jgi:hypothetical protein
MQITIKMKNNYGIQTYYPLCPASELFAKIAGTKTLTNHALADIAALGYQIKIEQDEPKILRHLQTA